MTPPVAQGDLGLQETDRPGLRMTRIAIRPTWVGLRTFADRFPAGIGGIHA